MIASVVGNDVISENVIGVSDLDKNDNSDGSSRDAAAKWSWRGG